MAKEKKAIMEDVQVAAFKLLKEEYGVNILNVQEIKVLTDITRVPLPPTTSRASSICAAASFPSSTSSAASILRTLPTRMRRASSS